MASASGAFDQADAAGKFEGDDPSGRYPPSTIPSFSESYKDSPTYPMDRKRMGQMLIVNNRKFVQQSLPERTGSDIDARKIEDCFRRLGFDCDVKHNMKKNDLLEKLEVISREETDREDKANCFICVILTYGHDGLIYCYDSDYTDAVSVDTVLAPMKSDRCTGLAGRPKLFFIQACDPHSLTSADGKGPDDEKFVEQIKIPIEADLLVNICNIPGFRSWNQDSKKGSWFIESLTEVLKEECIDKLEAGEPPMDVLKMSTRINSRVLKEMEEHKSKGNKVPCINSTLTKKVIFPRKK